MTENDLTWLEVTRSDAEVTSWRGPWQPNSPMGRSMAPGIPIGPTGCGTAQYVQIGTKGVRCNSGGPD